MCTKKIQCHLKFSKEAYLNGKDLQDNIYCCDGRYDLIIATETFKAYLNESRKHIVIAIRGTKTNSVRDIIADLRLIGDNLHNSERYKNDKKTMLALLDAFKPEVYKYSATGHSLGSAIVRQLMKEFPFITKGVNFNGAFQPSDLLKQNPKVKDHYMNKDPLYKNLGFAFRNKKVYDFKPKRIQNFFDFVKRITQPLNPINYDAHMLSAFPL